MAHVLTFTNHAPIKIADADLIQTVWSARQDFGHHALRSYTTRRGNTIYWSSYNSGMDYGRGTATTRTYLRNVAEIKEYFFKLNKDAVYHAEVEAEVDPASIVDVDALA